MRGNGWFALECSVCSNPPLWADEEADMYCGKCREALSDE